LFSKPYAEFVPALRRDIQDPELREALQGGLRDGLKSDDVVKTSPMVFAAGSLQPLQNEIDLATSLENLKEHSDLIPYILRGGVISSGMLDDKIVVTSNGGLVDGNHHWAAVCMANPNAKLATVDLNVDSPQRALEVSQAAAATMLGEVPSKQVAEGMNIYTMSPDRLEQNLKMMLSHRVYDGFFKADPQRFQNKRSVRAYLFDNLLRMRNSNRPMLDVPRPLMPQLKKRIAGEALQALNNGEVNISEPYEMMDAP
jgi:hypothetical protein